ncbi:hypothetical protein BDR03DRAFT_61582 [Suillus americanus]|nr:hypothetical protein BDR03DRAFT_61582 [Suillus americanus]
MKRAVHTPYSPVSLSHQYRSLHLLGTGFLWMGEILLSTNSRCLRFFLSQLVICFSSSSTTLIYLFTSASVPSPHYLLISHQSGFITHSLTLHSKRVPSAPPHHRFRSYCLRSCPHHLIIPSLYNNPLLFCTMAPLSPSLYNLILSLYDCPRRYTR